MNAEAEQNNQEDAELETCQFLTFCVEDNEYMVDITRVCEIRGWSETTRIPNSPDYMRGVINLRGLVIPIFDLKNRFGIGKTVETTKHVVIVLSIGERMIGILVDAVSDILTVAINEIKDSPSINETNIDDKYIKGLVSTKEKMIILLDIDYLFDNKTLTEADEAAL